LQLAFNALMLLMDGRKGILLVKKLSGGVLALLSIWSRCIFAYCLADATATHYHIKSNLLKASFAPVNPDWLYQNGSAFLVPAYQGCLGEKAVK